MYLTFIGCLYFFITASDYFPSFQPAVLFIISYRASLVVTTFLNFYLPATKSLQSCLTLCDLIDGSPPGSPIPEEHWSGLPFPSPMHENEK